MVKSDDIVDRRRLKRQLTRWRLAALLAAAAALIVAAGIGPWRLGTVPAGLAYVARIDLAGMIVDDPLRDEALAEVADDPRAKALIVRINSPGGTAAGSEAAFAALRRVAGNKPVVAVMGEVAASGGYMASLAADRIFARAGTVTGSIGAIWQTTNVTGLLDKVGVSTETFKSGPLKAQPNPFEATTEEARAVTRGLVGEIHKSFVAMVADRRGLATGEVLALADGRVFTGSQAMAAGLVDAIGGETEARAWLAAEKGVPRDLDAVTVAYGREGWLVGALGQAASLGGFGPAADWARKIFFSERLTLDGLMAVWHPE